MIVTIEETRILLQAETPREGYKIGRLSNNIGCGIIKREDRVFLDFDIEEVFELSNRLDELKFKEV